MLVSLWSSKGGVGVSVTAALVGLRAGRRDPDGVLLVDLRGDLPLVLGSESGAPGLTDWLGRGEAMASTLIGTAEPVAPGVVVVPRGVADWPEDLGGLDRLIQALADHPATVVVDAGPVVGDGPAAAVAARVAAESHRSLLVTRACYLGLVRARQASLVPSGVVLVHEPDRALTAVDVEAAIGAPVVARIDVDPAIARAVDAGLLGGRPPRGLDRVLDAVA